MSQTHLTPHPPFDHFCIFMSTCRPMEVIPPFRHHQRWFVVLTWCPTKVVAVVSRWSPAPNAAARIGKMTMRDLECPVRWILITPCFSCLAWYKIRGSAPRLYTLYRAGNGKPKTLGNLFAACGMQIWYEYSNRTNKMKFDTSMESTSRIYPWGPCDVACWNRTSVFFLEYYAKHRDFWQWYVICWGLENLDYVMVQICSDNFKHYCECWTSWWLVKYHTLNIFHA